MYDCTMKIIVFGANGRVGTKVVYELLARGYDVRAFVRGHHSFESSRHLEVIQGDIYDARAVRAAIDGCDAVISALGSWGTPKKDILSTAMKHIVPAMHSLGVSRIISLTGQDARDVHDNPSWFQKMFHWFLLRVAKQILEDGEAHIRELRESSLNWTVLRSPIMNSRGHVNYVLSAALPYPWVTIHRQSVAIAMVDQLEDASFIGTSPFLHRS